MKNPTEMVTDLFIATDQRNWQALADTFDKLILLDYSSMTGNPPVRLTDPQVIDSWKGVLPGFKTFFYNAGHYPYHK